MQWNQIMCNCRSATCGTTISPDGPSQVHACCTFEQQHVVPVIMLMIPGVLTHACVVCQMLFEVCCS